MELDEFERIVEQAFDRLPDNFREAIENLGVVVEDYPTDEIVHKMGLSSKYHLLGLYQGIPLPQRGSWYGMSPVLPDKVSLYRKNIEASVRHAGDATEQLEAKIAEVLIHEIGHYFGMNDEEIRKAGY